MNGESGTSTTTSATVLKPPPSQGTQDAQRLMDFWIGLPMALSDEQKAIIAAAYVKSWSKDA